jgi:hypothetical protein
MFSVLEDLDSPSSTNGIFQSVNTFCDNYEDICGIIGQGERLVRATD